MIALHLLVFVVSAIGIAYQVTLMRLFSIGQWHHFAYMIISIAMLGFGAGGVLLALAGAQIAKSKRQLLGAAVTLLAISLPLCYMLSQRVPFETFEIISQTRQQLRHLLLLYVILAVPFFLTSVCIALALMQASTRVGRLYCANMVGSGAGAFAMIGLLSVIHPQRLPSLMALALLVALLCAGSLYVAYPVKRTVISVALIVAAAWLGWTPVRISDYKGLSYTLQYPDARVVEETTSPLSVLTAVASEQIRETPGQLSYSYPWSERGPIPPQIGLYFDAGGVSPISRFDGDLEPFSYWDYVPPAIAYQLVERPKTLVIGAGGGGDVLGALYHNASHVDAVEVDPTVFDLLQSNAELNQFYGDLYNHPKVTPIVADGRGYAQSHEETYDLIQIALLDSFSAASAGVHALNESYLYTVEALQLFMNRLTSDGVLAITRWLKTPPRDALKLFATAVEACEGLGFEDPAAHLVFIRSWNTGTVVVSRAPLDEQQIAAAREFANSRGFDVCFLPDMKPEEANRFMMLEEPYYYAFAHEMLYGDRQAAYDNAHFYLRPATDDRPYFFRFLKWSKLPELLRTMGWQWAPFMEWGYITLTATLAQGIVVSFVLILLPLFVLSRRPKARRARLWVILYFAGLGLAYMFLEIAVIQRLMLFLAYPVYAVAVTLTGFLVFSGMGSYAADALYRRYGAPGAARTVTSVAAIILVMIVLYVAALPTLFRLGAGWSDPAKIIATLVVMAPLAFVMGAPFPTGLQLITDADKRLLPWAWGINGCFSVIGAAGATFVAIHGGFAILVLAAAALYLGCAACLFMLRRAITGHASNAL